MPEFIQQSQDMVMEDPMKEICALLREMGVGVAFMKLALNEVFATTCTRDTRDKF